MTVQQIKEAFQRRATVNDEWDYGVQQCWSEEIALLTDNVDDTISFLEHYCTGDEFAWMSEIFDEISEKLQSREFIVALKGAAARFPEETEKYNIVPFIESAEAKINVPES